MELFATDMDKLDFLLDAFPASAIGA